MNTIKQKSNPRKKDSIESKQPPGNAIKRASQKNQGRNQCIPALNQDQQLEITSISFEFKLEDQVDIS